MKQLELTPGTRLSAPIIVMANTAPLVGALYFHWDVFHILFLMWCENVVLGAVNLLRIASASGDGSRAMHFFKPFAMLCFAGPFAIFTVAHGQMILTLLGEPVLGWRPGELGPDFFSPPFYALAQLWTELRIPFAATCVSHLASYVLNDLWQGEYRRTKIMDTMKQPYRRLVPMHIAVACGALAIEGAGTASGLLALLVVLKTVADLYLHLQQHPGESGRTATTPL